MNEYDLDGKAGWSDNIRKGVQSAAKFVWNNRGTIANVASIGLMFVPGLGSAAVAYKAYRIVSTAVKIAKIAKVAKGNYYLGSAGRVTATVAKKIFTSGPRGGIKIVRGPAIKKSGLNQMNFQRYTKAPTSRSLQKFPNRVANGHLTIKDWF